MATTTTTTMPPCSYTLGPSNQAAYPATFLGTGNCPVGTMAGCSWSAVTGQPWINIQNPNGTGSGQVNFTLDANTGNTRTGSIRILEGNGPSCSITQTGPLGLHAPAPGGAWTSELDVPGGRGQVVVDGASATFQERGSRRLDIEASAGVHRIETTLVTAEGRPGTWRFEHAGGLVPGSLRVIAGQATDLGGTGLLFRLQGRPGERLVFVFRTAP